jgi:hypothetical protein
MSPDTLGTKYIQRLEIVMSYLWKNSLKRLIQAKLSHYLALKPFYQAPYHIFTIAQALLIFHLQLFSEMF